MTKEIKIELKIGKDTHGTVVDFDNPFGDDAQWKLVSMKHDGDEVTERFGELPAGAVSRYPVKGAMSCQVVAYKEGAVIGSSEIVDLPQEAAA